jgi:hypothetical protein
MTDSARVEQESLEGLHARRSRSSRFSSAPRVVTSLVSLVNFGLVLVTAGVAGKPLANQIIFPHAVIREDV